MSEADLEALKPQLLALDPEAIEEPRLPMAVALQEANDLVILLAEDPPVLEKLSAVGLDRAVVDGLASAVGATRAAQSRWVVLRDQRKPEAQREREARGSSLRAELASAAGWNLRANERAIETLSAISEGEGAADLVQDLVDLATLVEKHREDFAKDQTFDAAASLEQARSLSAEISAGAGLAKLDGPAAEAKALRDRAYTHLAEIVAQVRAAGQYAYRSDDRAAKRFASAYLGRRRRRAAKKAKASEPA